MLILKDSLYAYYKYTIINKEDILSMSKYGSDFTITTSRGFHLTIPYKGDLSYKDVRSVIKYIAQLCETDWDATKVELEEDILQHLKDLKEGR